VESAVYFLSAAFGLTGVQILLPSHACPP